MGSTPIGLSASRGSAILGVSQYKTPLEAWLEVMEGLQPGFCNGNGFEKPERVDPWEEPLRKQHAPLRWGLAFEDPICEMVAGVTDREKEFRHKDFDFITCHIDGLKNGRIQENKTAMAMAFQMKWGEPGSDLVPTDYQVQAQHQMMTEGTPDLLDFNLLVFPKAQAEFEKEGYRISGSYGTPSMVHPDGRVTDLLDWAISLKMMGYFYHYHTAANTGAQKAMLDRYRAFWNDNVLKETPPPVKGYDDIKWLIAAPEGELEASDEMKELWSELIDGDEEIDSIVKRKAEIKTTMVEWVQKEMQAKKVKKGNEPHKLNVYAGPRKIFSITRAWPGLRVSKSMIETLQEHDTELYETMKKTSFADIMPDEIHLTDGQKKKVDDADAGIEVMFSEFRSRLVSQVEKTRSKLDEKEDKAGVKICDQLIAKIQKESGLPKEMEARTKAASLKLTKLLTKDQVMKMIQKNNPEMFRKVFERGIVEETNPKSTLRISKPEKE